MPHFIVRTEERQYAYPRAATGEMYISRTAFGSDIEKARVFNNSAAAKNAMRGILIEDTYEIVPVRIVTLA